jgi:ABC-type molybdate transport system substrate-binding protein
MMFRLRKVISARSGIFAMVVLSVVSSAAAQSSPSSTTSAATADPAFKQKWDQLVADAKKEGRLVIISTTGVTRSMPPLVKEFERRFGIDVTMAPGGPSAHVERVTALTNARPLKTNQYKFDLAKTLAKRALLAIAS